MVHGLARKIASTFPAEDAGAGGKQELFDLSGAPALPAFTHDHLQSTGGRHAAEFGDKKFPRPKTEFSLAAFGGRDIKDPSQFPGVHHGADGNGIHSKDGADNIDGDESGAPAKGELMWQLGHSGANRLTVSPFQWVTGLRWSGHGAANETAVSRREAREILRLAIGPDLVFGAVDD